MSENIESCVRQLFETMPRMIIVTSADGQLEYVNRAILELVGVPFEDLAGTKWVNLIHPDDAQGVLQEWLRCSTAKLPFKYCCRVRTLDGTYRWCQSLVKPLLDELGGVVKFYGQLVDIDDAHRVDDSLRESEPTLQFFAHRLDEDRLRRVLDYIAANIEHEVTLADLAGVAGYSPFHFSRKFTRAIGMPPHRYISRMRLDNAMAELAAGKIPLIEIALNAHFSSQASFTRAFRRAIGVTPKEYQRRRRHPSRKTSVPAMGASETQGWQGARSLG